MIHRYLSGSADLVATARTSRQPERRPRGPDPPSASLAATRSLLFVQA